MVNKIVLSGQFLFWWINKTPRSVSVEFTWTCSHILVTDQVHQVWHQLNNTKSIKSCPENKLQEGSRLWKTTRTSFRSFTVYMNTSCTFNSFSLYFSSVASEPNSVHIQRSITSVKDPWQRSEVIDASGQTSSAIKGNPKHTQVT